MAKSQEKTRQIVETEFVAAARRVLADELVSLILYGSYLKDSFVPGVSDINVLVIVSKNTPTVLKKLGSEAGRMMSRHKITPLILSRKEFMNSADVFPMEYMDIVETHHTLMGPDVTLELQIDKKNLRHQVEHQLRGNLMSLRQLAVAAGRAGTVRKTMVRRELQQWYGQLTAVLRGILRLKGVADIPSSPELLMQAANEALGFESGPIVQLLKCRQKGSDCPDTLELVEGVLERLSALVEVVDSLDGDAS